MKKTFLLLLFALGISVWGWGQQVIGTYPDMNGGFEATEIIDNSTTYSSAQSGKWVKNNASSTISEESTIVRSGSKSLMITNNTTTGRRVWSPLVTVVSTTSNVTIQFFRRVTNTTNTQENQLGVGNGTTTGEGLSGSYTTPSAADTWEKTTYTRSSWTFTNIAGVIMSRQKGTGGNMYVDDFVMYNGAVDNTVPNSPGSVTVSNPTTSSLDVSWGAASGGVDGGGYLVVRFASDPGTGNDPNQNGIYAVGNTIPTGGTVRYIGTGLSFTDDVGLTLGTQYWYKVYTVDKAFNYSSESTGTGSTSGGSTPLISVNTSSLSGFTYVEGSGPSESQNFLISGENLTHNINIAASSNYEISLDDSDFSESPIILTQSGGSVSSTTIYVRLKAGLSAGSYNSEEITASSTGAENKTVSCSGSVSPPPDPEPTNHATDFTATTNSHNQITLTWTDATGAQLPHAYLVKAAVAPATPTAPTDGVAEGDGTLVKNIDFGDEEAVFTGLDPETTYNFAIWPYTNGGSSIDYKIGGQPTAVAQTEEQPYIVDFEGTGETKTAYTSGTVTLSGIDWDMTEALIGIDAADWKNGARSARLRGYGTSSMTMLENKPDGIGTISFSYRRYGSDTQVDWKVEYSIDKGLNWTQVGSAFTAPASDVVQTFSETVNVPGNVRIRIKRATESGASNQRLNIDDIAITDYEVATFTGTGAWTETARWSTGQVPGSSDEVLIHGSCSVAGAVTIGTVYIGSDYSLEIETTGALTINTKLVNNEALFIYSDASGTGSLIVNGTVSGSGKAYIERYLTKYDSQNDNKYHFISAPVTAQAIRPEFVANTPAEDEDFYYFDEEQNLWINSKTETNEWNAGFENNFIVGKGYMASYPANGSKLFEGTLNNDASYVLTCTHTTDQGKGWNLLGNPYQAAIDWDAVTLEDGMDNALYYYDSQNEKYRYYISYPGINNANYLGSGSRYIPPMQGFMVHAKSTGTKTVTIEKADLAHQAQSTFYKSGYNLVPGSMALTLISGERRDEAFVHFTSGATEAFDGQYDAYKLLSGNAAIPEIYTTNSGNVKFAINGLPELGEQTEVPVSIKANQPGVYSISADLSNLPATAYLNDLKTGTVHNLSQNPVYTFTAAEGDNPNRFKLTFGSVGIETPAGQPIAAYYAAGRLHFVNAQDEKTIEVFNLAGQRIIFAKTTADEYPVNLSAGMYVVKVSTAQQLVSAKFFVK